MVDSSPIVSIIIPTKNRADLLMETLGSCLAQTDGRWEALVMDDNSRDDTAIRTQAIDDPRVFYQKLTPDKHGAPAARNLGVSMARGQYIIFLDSDDFLASHCIAQRIAVMSGNPTLDFAQAWRAVGKVSGDVHIVEFFLKRDGVSLGQIRYRVDARFFKQVCELGSDAVYASEIGSVHPVPDQGFRDPAEFSNQLAALGTCPLL